MNNKTNKLKVFPNNDPVINPRWYAIYTQPRNEKKVRTRLQQKGIETFLPLKKEEHEWSDRTKVVEVPLIRSYTFVHIPLKKTLEVCKTPGVICFVKFKGEYAPIPNYQIEGIKKVLEKDTEMEPTDYFNQGDLVEIIKGPMKGIKGRVKNRKNKTTFILSVDAIQASYKVDVQPENLKLVEKMENVKKGG